VGEPETDDILREAKAGSREAHDRLFNRVAERLLLYIRLRMGHALAARLEPGDVLQEAYAEAHRSMAGFEPDGERAFARWMYRIVDNRLLDLARHHGAQKRRPPAGFDPSSQVFARVAATDTGPSTAFDRGEQEAQLALAMERLTNDERQAILLRHFQERTLSEIADALGRSETAVRRLLNRARLKLGAALR
jgi:RNA polymerase sigma-70 factor (ECF subfamily)